jgi:hypothetical protein
MSVFLRQEGSASFCPDNARFRHSKAHYLDKNLKGVGRDSNGTDEIIFNTMGR